MSSIFGKMRKNPDGTTTTGEFINTWLESEELLRGNIEVYESKIEDLQIKRDETVIELGKN